MLKFGHEGVLYKKSFVMYDKKTNSKWIHVTGRAVKGSLRGKVLDFLPSVVTTWKEWKKNHPKTKVLLGRRREGFMGTFYAKWRSKRFGLAVAMEKSRLYPYPSLKKRPIVNDKLGDTSLLVVYDSKRVVHCKLNFWINLQGVDFFC